MRVFVIAGLLLLSTAVQALAAAPLRVGFFANVTHSQALIGKGNGEFERRTGQKIDWKIFNAGPTAMEALIAGAIDIAYVGPNPAVNAYFRSGGKVLKIVAGAASGGAGLVVAGDSGIRAARDLKGKKVASPEFGNTQDVALRSWLKSQRLIPGRDVQVIPMKNPDILTLFQQKKIAAAWVPEPWLTRLLYEAGGKLFLDERSLWKDGKFTTAVVVVRSDFLAKNRELVKRFIATHVDITEWARKEPVKAQAAFNREFGVITRKPMNEKTLADLSKRLLLTTDPLVSSLVTSAGNAASLGFLPVAARDTKKVAAACDLSILNEVLKERKLPTIR